MQPSHLISVIHLLGLMVCPDMAECIDEFNKIEEIYNYHIGQSHGWISGSNKEYGPR